MLPNREIENSAELDHDLNQLKKVFDLIEPYEQKDNIGYRSLKNIGVWLIAYALLEPSQKESFLKNTFKKINNNQNQNLDISFDMFYLLSEKLSRSDYLTQIINDYAEANGQFKIILNEESLREPFLESAKKAGIYKLVNDHLSIDTTKPAILSFDMQNTMTFSWQEAPHQYTPEFDEDGVITFNGMENTKSLTANSDQHKIDYKLVTCEEDKELYHVVKFGTKEYDEKAKQSEYTAMYLIEPVEDKNQALLQKNYFNIIKSFKKREENASQREQLMQVAKNAPASLRMSRPLALYDSIKWIVHFPQLLDKLKTTEKRLGIYENYQRLEIGSITAYPLCYLGERGLKYDKKGGEVTNVEVVCVPESCAVGGIMSEPITIEYTVTKPYMMVYEAKNQSDYYAFRITDPVKNLERTFEAHEQYAHSAVAHTAPAVDAVNDESMKSSPFFNKNKRKSSDMELSDEEPTKKSTFDKNKRKLFNVELSDEPPTKKSRYNLRNKTITELSDEEPTKKSRYNLRKK